MFRLPLSLFYKLTRTIFSCLNVRDLEVDHLHNILATSEFYELIQQCNSLRVIKFNKFEDANRQLEVISLNHNIKQAHIIFRDDDINKNIEEKVEKLLLLRKDTSLIIDHHKFSSLSKISQTFKISPF